VRDSVDTDGGRGSLESYRNRVEEETALFWVREQRKMNGKGF